MDGSTATSKVGQISLCISKFFARIFLVVTQSGGKRGGLYSRSCAFESFEWRTSFPLRTGLLSSFPFCTDPPCFSDRWQHVAAAMHLKNKIECQSIHTHIVVRAHFHSWPKGMNESEQTHVLPDNLFMLMLLGKKRKRKTKQKTKNPYPHLLQVLIWK